jgi:phospholipid/cholesterol/gamma-HCH transport system ATP-binding protein
MIRIKNIWKAYDDVQVLKGLSLDVPDGKTTVILGRSGVGKSVLLRQIACLESPDEGTIEANEIDLSTLEGKARKDWFSQMGMLFQSSALFDSMTIEENVAFSLVHYSHGTTVSKEEIQKAVDESLEKVGLSGYQKKHPSELSGGQKRRAALARLIVYRPKVLLCDEPTTGLDPVTANQIAELISQTRRELNGTAIVVTHDIVSSITLGDHFALHHDGKIVITGDKDQFFSSEDPLLHEFLQSALVPEAFAKLVRSAAAQGQP